MNPTDPAEQECQGAKHAGEMVGAMTRRGQRWRYFAWVTAVICGAALGKEDARQDLQRQRAAIEAKFTREKQECEQRFIVTACVEQLQQRRREALEQVRQREIQIDDAQRAAAAAENRQRLLKNQAQAEARQRRKAEESRASASSGTAASASDGAPPKPLRQTPLRTGASASATMQHSPSDAAADERAEASRRSAERQARAAARAEASLEAAEAAEAAAQRASEREKRLAEAAERRERIEMRNRQRAAEGAAAAPLPVPGAGCGPTH
jgi:hypothetical protein